MPINVAQNFLPWVVHIGCPRSTTAGATRAFLPTRRRRLVWVVAALVGIIATGAGCSGAARGTGTQYAYMRPLDAEETVFAYSRISPDGRFLAYSSERPDPTRQYRRQRTVTVVRLEDQRIVFTENGVDAYWSPDGRRMIFGSKETPNGVSIWTGADGTVARNVMPANLGDYFSWGTRGTQDVILTIDSNYVTLDGTPAVGPHLRVPPCPDIGIGDRPLLSKDASRITTFVRGAIVVRNLEDCRDTLETFMPGGKADFSWDNRYIAFHTARPNDGRHEIKVVDVKRRTVIPVTDLPGNSFFPSWTRDGRLSFRYDSPEYRGFVIASGFLQNPATPLPTHGPGGPRVTRWEHIFGFPAPSADLALVLVWATWGAHCPDALIDFQRVANAVQRARLDIRLFGAPESASPPGDIARLLQREGIRLPQLVIPPEALSLTGAHNQIPATLLFRRGELVDHRLGAQSYKQLRAWIQAASHEPIAFPSENRPPAPDLDPN